MAPCSSMMMGSRCPSFIREALRASYSSFDGLGTRDLYFGSIRIAFLNSILFFIFEALVDVPTSRKRFRSVITYLSPRNGELFSDFYEPFSETLNVKEGDTVMV